MVIFFAGVQRVDRRAGWQCTALRDACHPAPGPSLPQSTIYSSSHRVQHRSARHHDKIYWNRSRELTTFDLCDAAPVSVADTFDEYRSSSKPSAAMLVWAAAAAKADMLLDADNICRNGSRERRAAQHCIGYKNLRLAAKSKCRN